MAFIKRGSQTELPARDWVCWSRPLSRSFQGQRQALRQCSAHGLPKMSMRPVRAFYL
jgi:hypothetical protein